MNLLMYCKSFTKGFYPPGIAIPNSRSPGISAYNKSFFRSFFTPLISTDASVPLYIQKNLLSVHRNGSSGWAELSRPSPVPSLYYTCSPPAAALTHTLGLLYSKVAYATASDTINLIKVPKMGESITEGVISEWKKSVGDIVQVDDVICVIETDKVSVDIHADVGGRIVMQAAEEGGTIFVGADLVALDTSVCVDQEVTSQAKVVNKPEFQKRRQSSAVFPPLFRARAPSIKFSCSVNAVGNNAADVQPSIGHQADVSDAEQGASVSITRYAEGTLPGKYKPSQLSEEEIQIINSGGIAEGNEAYVGKWKTVLQQEY